MGVVDESPSALSDLGDLATEAISIILNASV